MTKIAPIIMNFFRASYICGSKYILTQEHDQETFSSFVHPYYTVQFLFLRFGSS